MSESKNKLKQISPGFFSDRDEDWMSYLASKTQSKLKKYRTTFYDMTEAFDQFKMAYLAEMTQMKNASEQEKANKTKQFNDKKKLFEANCEELIKRALVKYSEAKEEARKIKKAHLQEESERFREQTRYNQDNDNVIDIDGDLDALGEELEDMGVVTLSSSNYLPNAIVDKKPSVNVPSFTRPKQPVPSKSSTAKPKTDNIDPLFKGLPDEDVMILKEVKPLVQKYDCIDRTRKALESYKKSKKELAAMQFFMETVTKMKDDVRKYRK